MDLLPPKLQDLSLLIIAAVYLPKDLPQLYWYTIGEFASQGGESLRLAVENITVFNEQPFITDKQLIDEIYAIPTMPRASARLGIVFISSKIICSLCGRKLLIRHDRACKITVYTESFGTVIGTHYHKFCQNFRRNCTFKQYYGYSSETKDVYSYDSDCKNHKYIWLASKKVNVS